MENWKVIGVVYWRINVRITTATTGEGDGGGDTKKMMVPPLSFRTKKRNGFYDAAIKKTMQQKNVT